MEAASRTLVLSLMTAILILAVGVTDSLAQTNPFTLSQTYCLNSTTPCVLTYHNDNNRDGVNPNETVLKASTLNTTSHPQPKWLASTDGLIYTQPLYVYQIPIPGKGTKNVVYAATENNTVYAFDADSTSSTGTVLKSAQLNNASDLGSGSTEIALPWNDTQTFGCTNLVPEIGVTGTPVIDVSVTPPVIYLVTTHEDIDSNGGKTYRQKLHGLFADSLTEIPGSPVILDSTFANNTFRPSANLQRAGLTLVIPPLTGLEDVVDIWVAFASNCDDSPYNGFAVMFSYLYNGTTPGFSSSYTIFNSESTCQTQPCEGGIWMAGAAPAADSFGNVYLVTGNGDDQNTQGSGEYSNSVVKVNQGGFQDFYSPPDYHQLNVGDGMNGSAQVACTNATTNNCPSWCRVNGQYCQVGVTKDFDLGSGGLTLLSPTFNLAHPELVTAGKQGMLYVVFSGSMGGIDGKSGVPDQYACMAGSTPASGTIRQCFDGIKLTSGNGAHGLRGSPAFFAGSSSSPQNYLYVAGVGDTLKAFQMNTNHDGTLNTTAVLPNPSHTFNNPGAVPSITWNSSGNTTDAIVWALDTNGFGNVYQNSTKQGNPASVAQLWAYGAVPSGAPSLSLPYLWDTNSTSDGPFMQGQVKFMAPTIVDGKIFLAGGAQNYYPGCPPSSGSCPGTGWTACPTPSKTVQPSLRWVRHV